MQDRPQGAHRRRLAAAAMAAVTLLGACSTTNKGESVGFGAQPERLGFVPAAAAIVPCRAWPASARFLDLPLTTANATEVATLCAAFDQFVLQGYANQPYMRGYTPKFVAKGLEAAGRPTLLNELEATWQRDGAACAACRSAPAFYAASIADRTAWLAWLANLSTSAKTVDAVLLPFIMYAQERRYNDRGLIVAERSAGITLLLIDTTSGALIWAGGREATVPTKELDRAGGAADPSKLAAPPWDEVLARVLTEDVWRGFPGRQTY